MDAVRQNKVYKYTLYAMGEIFLIIVGILIAVQINDWNEHRKEKQAELKLFERMLIACETERLAIGSHISSHREAIESLNRINRESADNIQLDDSKNNYTQIVHQSNRPSVLTAEFGEEVSSISDFDVKNQLRICINAFEGAGEFGRNAVIPLIEDTKVEIMPFIIKEYLGPDDEFGIVDVDPAAFQSYYREDSEFRDLLYRLYLDRRSNMQNYEFVLERVEILSETLERKIAEVN